MTKEDYYPLTRCNCGKKKQMSQVVCNKCHEIQK